MLEGSVAEVAFINRRKEQYLRLAESIPAYNIRREIQDYERELPKFQGETLMHFVKERKERGENADVLDIGCGEGRALGQLVGERVRGYGLTAAEFRPKLPARWRELVAHVDYKIGDAHNLQQIYGDQRFDFIISLATFVHLADPLDVLAQSYALLRVGGMAFIDHVGLELTGREMKLMEDFWAKYGAEVDLSPGIFGPRSDEAIYLCDLALRKHQEGSLPLPVQYHLPTLINPSIYSLKIKVTS